jgi:hypothetical protein
MSKPSLPNLRQAYLALIDDTLAYLSPFSQKKTPLKKPCNLQVFCQLPKQNLKPPKNDQPPLPSPPVIPNQAAVLQKQDKAALCQNKAFISLIPPTPPPKTSFEEIQKLIAAACPNLPLNTTIPSDDRAKKLRTSWKAKAENCSVAILSLSCEFRSFFSNLAKAITIVFEPSKVIATEPLEKANQWEFFLASKHLKLIIAPNPALFESKNLLCHYREVPQKHLRLLGDVPLLLLPDPTFYIKDPLLKRSLWHLIEKKLQ